MKSLISLGDTFEKRFDEDSFLGQQHKVVIDWYKSRHRQRLKELIVEISGYVDSIVMEVLKGINENARKWADKVLSLRSHDNLDERLKSLIDEFNRDSNDHEDKVIKEVNKKFQEFKTSANAILRRMNPVYFDTLTNTVDFSQKKEDIVKFDDIVKSEVFKEWFKSRNDLSRNLIFRGISLLPEGARMGGIPNEGLHGRRMGSFSRSPIGLVPWSKVKWSELSNGKFTMVPTIPLSY